MEENKKSQFINYFLPGEDYNYKNFREFVDKTCEKYNKKPFIRMRGKDDNYDEWSFDQVKEEILRISSWLASKGLKSGDKIAILSENRPQWCFIYLATLYSGFTAIPLDSLMESESLSKIASFAEVNILFYSDRLKDKADIILESYRSEITVNFDSPLWDEISAFPPNQVPDTDVSGDALAVIIFTSGTTGLSKGVMLSHQGLIKNANASVRAFEVKPEDNLIVVLPLHHSYPATQSFLTPMIEGAAITIAEKIVGPKIIANIVETKGTIVIAVPLLFDKIKKAVENGFNSQPFIKRILIKTLFSVASILTFWFKIPVGVSLFRSIRKKAGLDTIKFMVSGGGPLSKATADFFEVFGCNLVQGYGLSENSPLVTANTVKFHNNASIGFPVKHTQVRIADAGKNGVGEIQVKSPSVMLGYYKNPEATKESFTEDGWLKTGDLAKVKRGYIHISGRIKNIIVTNNGKNIYPEEIEEEFSSSEIIAEILVIGKESAPGTGINTLVAVCFPDYESIKKNYPTQADDADFIKQLISAEIREKNRKFSSHKKISEIIIRDTEFEITSSLKIKRYLYQFYANPQKDTPFSTIENILQNSKRTISNLLDKQNTDKDSTDDKSSKEK